MSSRSDPVGKDYVRDVTSYENLELVGVDNENIVIGVDDGDDVV